MKENIEKRLIDFINNSPSVFQSAENIEKKLLSENYIKLSDTEKWDLSKNGKYFLTKNSSCVIAFTVGESLYNKGFKMLSSHIDSPCFIIKPNEAIIVEDKYVKLNVETYGGVILNTWFDRPLGIAGRIMKKGKGVFPEEILLNVKKPVLIIPSLAIHMNREINNGYKYNKQKDMLPLLGMVKENFEKHDYLLNIISEETGINKNEIIDFELYLYEYEKGRLTGFQDEFISASRLDDLMMAYTSLEAFIDSESSQSSIIIFTDHEEIGSQSAEGALSNFYKDVIERIVLSLGGDREDFYVSLNKSIMMSADLAHALHPNYADLHDPTSKPVLGKGIVIKTSYNQKYSSSGTGTALLKALCQNSNIDYQMFANRSDMQGGSTIGPMFAAGLGINVIDIGAPILAMHSVRELAAVKDVYSSYDIFKAFLECEL